MFKRTGFLEGILLTIAIGGLGMAAYNSFAASSPEQGFVIEDNVAVIESGTSRDAETAAESRPAVALDDDSQADFAEVVDEDTDERFVEPDDGFEDEEFEDDEADEFDFDEDDINRNESGDNEPAEEENDDDEIDDEGEEELDIDYLSIVAQTIGVEIETIESGRMEGRSVAEIARENGVDPQMVVTALVDAELKLLEQLVDSGQIKRGDARTRLEESQLWFAFEVENPYPEFEIIAAQTLQVDLETIYDGIDDGQTFKDIAEANGSDGPTLIAAIVAAQTDYVDASIAAGFESEAWRAEWLNEIQQSAEVIVNQGFEAWEMMMDDGGFDAEEMHDEDEFEEADEFEEDDEA